MENGNAEQLTSGGLLVWRKINHFTAFTNGGKTWTQPVDLPKAPGQFGFAPLSEPDRARLAAALAEALGPGAVP